MVKRFLFVGILIIMVTQSRAQFAKSNMILEVINYGLMTCDSSSCDSVSKPDGFKLGLLYNAKIVEKTDTIEAILGNRFGVVYVLKYQHVSSEPILIEWIFPDKINEQYKHLHYVTNTTFYETFTAYTLEDEDELVKGTWQLRIYHKNKLLLIKDFYLI